MTLRTAHRHAVAVLIAIALLAVFAHSAAATVKISPCALDPKPLKTMAFFRAVEPGFPAALASDRDVYVVVYAGPSYLDVYLLAREGVEPRDLARKLSGALEHTSMSTQTVYYMRGHGYVWADAWRDNPRFGAMSLDNDVPLHSTLSGLTRAGLRPRTLLCFAKGAKPSHRLNIVCRVGRKWLIGEVSPLNARLDFALQTKLSGFAAFSTLGSSLLTWVVCLPLMLYLIRRARSRRTTTEGMRSFVSVRYFPVACICTALQTTAFGAAIKSRGLYMLLDTWVGEDFARLLFMLIVLGVVLPLAIGWVAPKVAFGGTADEKKQTWYRRSSMLTFGFIFLGLLVVDAANIPHALDSPLATHGWLVLLFFCYAVGGICRRLRRLWRRLSGTRTPDADTLARLAPLATAEGVRLTQVVAVEPRQKAKRAAAIVMQRDGVLLIRKQLLGDLEPEEIDFLAAHEFAHMSRSHTAKSAAMLAVGEATMITSACLLAVRSVHLSPTNWLLWTLALGYVVLKIEDWWLVRRREYTADRAALAMTRNPEAALQAVQKASDALDVSRGVDIHTFAFLLPARSKWLQKAAKEMQLDVESISGKHYEDPALTERAQDLARRMGVSFKKIVVVQPLHGKPLMNAAVWAGKIAVGQAAFEAFTPEEMDFTIAHELAHLKYRHLPFKAAVVIAGLLLMGLGVLPAMMSTLTHSVSSIGMWIVIAGGLLLMSGVTVISRMCELAADRLALRTTRNLPAAISTLRKLTAGNPDIPEEYEDYRTHPKLAYRVDALKKQATKLGLPVDDQAGRL